MLSPIAERSWRSERDCRHAGLGNPIKNDISCTVSSRPHASTNGRLLVAKVMTVPSVRYEHIFTFWERSTTFPYVVVDVVVVGVVVVVVVVVVLVVVPPPCPAL